MSVVYYRMRKGGNNMLKKGLIAGGVNFIVAMAINFGFMALIPSLAREYQNPGLFRPWSDPLMMLFFLNPFILGFLEFVWAMMDIFID